MPDPYIINGSIDLAGNQNRNKLTVQAFDRDLPSLERRQQGGPPLLGAATTDAEGRFQISYGLERFSVSEGGAPAADVSFRVFDVTGRELAIHAIRALEREYRGDQIVFNVPSPLNVILAVRGQAEGGSEYDRLVDAVSPIVAPLPLAEIGDDDIAFIAGELGYAAADEQRQHLEWVRRSAVLAADSGIPAEAFYGWGRKGLPAPLAELIAQPLSDLPAVTAKLSSTATDRLRDSLLAAIAENIISAGWRERAAAIASALHRRAQHSFTLQLRLQTASTADPLSGYAVTTVDIDRDNANLGSEVTDSLGEFTVAYFDDAEAGRAPRNLRFRARAPEANEAIEVTQRVQTTDAVIAVAIPVAGADRALDKVRELAQLQLPDDLAQKLHDDYGIGSLADIRRAGGLHRIAAIRKLDLPAIRRLDALADLDRLCRDVPEATALIDRDYDSVFAIADVTRARFVAAVGVEGSPISRERATELHIAATAQTDLLDQIFAGIAVDIAAGRQPQTGVAPDEYSPFPQEQNHG